MRKMSIGVDKNSNKNATVNSLTMVRNGGENSGVERAKAAGKEKRKLQTTATH